MGSQGETSRIRTMPLITVFSSRCRQTGISPHKKTWLFLHTSCESRFALVFVRIRMPFSYFSALASAKFSGLFDLSIVISKVRFYSPSLPAKPSRSTELRAMVTGVRKSWRQLRLT